MFSWGWKTIAGSTLIAIGNLLKPHGYPEIGDALISLGQMLLGIGIAHKFTKLEAALKSNGGGTK